MSKVKNCPFCGAEAHLIDGFMGIKVIICSECNAQSDTSDKAAEVIKLWNRRVKSGPA